MTVRRRKTKLPSMYDPKRPMVIAVCSRCQLHRELYKRGACGPCFAYMNLFSHGLNRR